MGIKTENDSRIKKELSYEGMLSKFMVPYDADGKGNI